MTGDLTPGQQAMVEAARMEAARVYGRTCPETRSGPAPLRPANDLPAGDFRDQVLALRAGGMSIAKIALRLGKSRDRVEWIVHRAERAS